MDFPLGVPKNRPEPKPEAIPIDGRPNWFRDRNGREFYVEPNKKPEPPPGRGEGAPS